MRIEALVIAAGAFALSALLTAAVRKLALSRGVIDVPNERSSHRLPTPRGGGLAIVLTMSAAAIALAAFGLIRTDLLAVLLGGGATVAVVGLMDDRNSVSARNRLIVHFGAALWAVTLLGGLPPIRFGDHLVHLGWFGHVLAVLGVVWTLNLFNFMDGLDGIAASEAVFVALCGALLSAVGANCAGIAPAAVAFAAACAGFLLWNWPPAKIFMGDVGSGYLGYVVAVLPLAAARDNPVAPWVWLILGGVFFVDSTVTLVRRALGGERVQVAHRSHAYQRLARRWTSHLKVTLGVTLTNLLWLLPCALIGSLHPTLIPWVAGTALAPLVILVLWAGAGTRERGDR